MTTTLSAGTASMSTSSVSSSLTPSPTIPPAPPAATTSSAGGGGGGPSSPSLLFFVALGFGVVFTNLWIIVGVKYCFRYNQRNRRNAAAAAAAQHNNLDENGEPIDLANLPAPTRRRRREKKLMTMEQVNERFPMLKYKAWMTSRAEEGLSTAGGVAPVSPSRAASIRNADAAPGSPVPTLRPSSGAKDHSPQDGVLPMSEKPRPATPEEESSAQGHEKSEQDTTTPALTSRADFVDSPTNHHQNNAANSSSILDSSNARTSSSPANADTVDEVGMKNDRSPTDAQLEDHLGPNIVPAMTTTTTSSQPHPMTAEEEDDDQIHAAVPTEMLNTPGDSCAICIDTLEDDDDVRGLTCGHAFHASCLDPWLTSRRACCPLCKADYYVPKQRPDADANAAALSASEAAPDHHHHRRGGIAQIGGISYAMQNRTGGPTHRERGSRNHNAQRTRHSLGASAPNHQTTGHDRSPAGFFGTIPLAFPRAILDRSRGFLPARLTRVDHSDPVTEMGTTAPRPHSHLRPRTQPRATGQSNLPTVMQQRTSTPHRQQSRHIDRQLFGLSPRARRQRDEPNDSARHQTNIPSGHAAQLTHAGEHDSSNIPGPSPNPSTKPLSARFRGILRFQASPQTASGGPSTAHRATSSPGTAENPERVVSPSALEAGQR